VKTILLLDTETTGTGPDDVAIEVACAIYSVPHAAIVRSFASLIRHDSNAAEHVNHIAPALLAEAPEAAPVWARVREMAGRCDVIVAHNAAFDRRFAPDLQGDEWVCSMDDIAWPRASKPAGESLISLALNHGLGIVSAHRAAADVDLLARLFTRAHELGADLDALLARAMRPKALFQSLQPFEQNDVAKAHGFRWNDPLLKAWSRRMAIEDVVALPFKVREIER
jgi:DNA polymerase-3 subunit epsilon